MATSTSLPASPTVEIAKTYGKILPRGRRTTAQRHQHEEKREIKNADERNRQHHQAAVQADLILNLRRREQLQQERAKIQQNVKVGEEIGITLRTHACARRRRVELKIDEQAGPCTRHGDR